MKEMKTLKFPNQDEPYEIVDAKARDEKQDKLTGAAGQLVGFDVGGNAVAQDISTIATALGAAKIQTGSYTGTGKYGSDNKNSLTFNFVPKLFIVAEGNDSNISNVYTWCGQPIGEWNEYWPKFRVSGNTITWWGNTANYHCNIIDMTYGYVAIG